MIVRLILTAETFDTILFGVRLYCWYSKYRFSMCQLSTGSNVLSSSTMKGSCKYSLVLTEVAKLTNGSNVLLRFLDRKRESVALFRGYCGWL